MAGLWIVVLATTAVVVAAIIALARGSAANNDLPYWLKVLQIFGPITLAILSPLVVLWYQTFTQCVKDAAMIRNEYPRLEDEFFFRRDQLFTGIQQAKALPELYQICANIPSFYADLRPLGLADISYKYGQLSERVEGHRKWESPGNIDPKYSSITYGICPLNLKDDDLGILQTVAARLLEFDEKNKIVGKVVWKTQCGLCYIIALAIGGEPQIIKFSRQQ